MLEYFLQAAGLSSFRLSSTFYVFNYIYPALVICVVVYAAMFSLKRFHEDEILKMSTVTLIANHLQTLSLCVASCVSVACSVVRYKKYNSAIKELIQIDNVMIHKLMMDVNRDTLNSNRLLFLSFLGSLLLIVLDYALLLLDVSACHFSYIISFHVSLAIILLSDCRVLITFKLLSHRFRYINNYLRPPTQKKVLDVQILTNIKYYTFTKRQIKELANIHSWLIRTAETLNSYFSPALLVEIAAYFTVSTCYIYTFCYLLTDSTLRQYPNLKNVVIYTAYWPLIIVMKLCLLLKSSGNLIEEVLNSNTF